MSSSSVLLLLIALAQAPEPAGTNWWRVAFWLAAGLLALAIAGLYSALRKVGVLASGCVRR